MNYSKKLIEGKAYSFHATYRVYTHVKERCYNSKTPCYKFYGGKGVKICDEWFNNPYSFCLWAMENGYRKGLQLDKDILGDGLLYSPSTCCFVTPKVNSNNKTNNRILIIDGEKHTMAQVLEKYNLKSDATLSRRLEKGWDIKKAIHTPPATPNPFHTYNGETLTLREWAARVGVSQINLYQRLERGWSLERALNTPTGKHKGSTTIT